MTTSFEKLIKHCSQSKKGWLVSDINRASNTNEPTIYVYLYTATKAIAMGGITVTQIDKLKYDFQRSGLTKVMIVKSLIIQIRNHIFNNEYSVENKELSQTVQLALYYLLITKTGKKVLSFVAKSPRSMSFFIIAQANNNDVVLRPFATDDSEVIELNKGLEMVKYVAERDEKRQVFEHIKRK